MKGLAPAHTLTGRIQRAITDEWQTQAELMWAARVTLEQARTVAMLLSRLVDEGRAEAREMFQHDHMGPFLEYRRPQ